MFMMHKAESLLYCIIFPDDGLMIMAIADTLKAYIMVRLHYVTESEREFEQEFSIAVCLVSLKQIYYPSCSSGLTKRSLYFG